MFNKFKTIISVLAKAEGYNFTNTQLNQITDFFIPIIEVYIDPTKGGGFFLVALHIFAEYGVTDVTEEVINNLWRNYVNN